MARNNNTIQDEDGDYSDWFELYNSTNSTINLEGFGISDDIGDLYKWSFPEVNLLPQSYLLIFASEKNRLDITELHTNFKISSSGEELFLTNNSGVIIDQTNSIVLSDDESYCRIPDGAINWVLVDSSTPGSTNNFSNQLLFSNQEGFYTTAFSLTINSLLDDTIYYTLNGDIPTENSFIFIDSLTVNDKNSDPNKISEIPTSPEQNLISFKAWESPSGLIDKATIVRCASYRNGIRTSKIYTKTFFVDSDISDKYTIPVISLVTKENNLFDSIGGIFVPGIHYQNNSPEWTGNYFMRGLNWEKEIHIEYFDQNGVLGFSQDAGLRIHGGKTRHTAQKSLRLYARNEYGTEHFNYKLLPKRQANQYKRFMLRTTMGAWGGETIIKDILAQNICSNLNIDYQEFQPVIVFMNGEFWGIHTIRDRVDERYIEYIHNIDKDSVEFKETGNVAYANLIDFIENNTLQNDDNYQYVQTQIDIDNYIDYTISELFFANYDWPANNLRMWRKIPDGKWRWIFYDLDAGFGSADYNMLQHSTRNDSSVTWPNSPSSTYLFRKLLENDLFKSKLINRYADILNSEFDVETMTNKFDSIKDLYEPEITSHIERWNYPASYNNWEDDLESELLTFIKERPCAVRNSIMTFFNLTNFNFDCNKAIDGTGNLILAPNPNNGVFFLLNHSNQDILNATIFITNMSGQIVYREKNVDLMKNERKYFDFLNLSSTMYLLQIFSDSHSEQKKIILN